MDVNYQFKKYLPQKWGRYLLVFGLGPLELWCDVFSYLTSGEHHCGPQQLYNTDIQISGIKLEMSKQRRKA